MPDFKDFIKQDLSNVLFNCPSSVCTNETNAPQGAGAFTFCSEFAAIHQLGGIRGKPPVECKIIIDKSLYSERAKADDIENIAINSLVMFIKEDDWTDSFGGQPKAGEALRLDGKQYRVSAVSDYMGLYEITLSGNRG